MAFAKSVIWEVRTGGATANGGGFDPVSGTPGTDYSQQDAAQVTYTDLVIDATTNTNCTSAGTPFTSAHVGNVINITSGTGFTVQRVQVMSVAAGVATCDKSLGTLSSMGGTGNLGGGLANPEEADVLMVAGNVCYIASGSYTKTSTRTITCDGSIANGECAFIGYPAGGTRADVDVIEGSMPVFTSATNSIVIFSLNAANRVRLRNIKCTHTAGTRGYGFRFITSTSTGIIFENVICDGCLAGWDMNVGASRTTWERCIAKNGTAGGWQWSTAVVASKLAYCIAHSNAGPGFNENGNGSDIFFSRCMSYGNTGASGHGFLDSTTTGDNNAAIVFDSCVAHGNAQSGFRFAYTTGGKRNMQFDNCIAYGNSAYGVSCATAGLLDGSYPRVRSFAFGNNTSGARQNFRTGEGDISLSADPFTNAAGGDFSLNSTSGGGAALRQLGYPSEIGIKGSATTNYPCVGASQTQISGGGGGLLTHPGMTGGMI